MAKITPKIVELEPFPADCNPFHHDMSNMGTRIGKDLMLMHSNHTHEVCKFLIFVDTKTGQRFRLELANCDKEIAIGNMIDSIR